MGINRQIGQPPVNLIPVRKTIESIIAVYEQFGVTQIGAVGMQSAIPPAGISSEVTDAMKQMFALGVTMARAHSPVTGPRSLIQTVMRVMVGG